ncbi:MAG: ClpP family protease [Planctomycetota bacterium]|jgi:ATP-dependent Clp protease protease subunit
MRAEEDKEQKAAKRSPAMDRYLLKARSVLIFGPIEPAMTRSVVTQLLLMNQMSKTKPIRVYVNSPGGLADDGFAIYDVMRFVSAPVYSVCSGLAASAATIVMVGAQKGRRFIFPHSRVMLHQPSQGARGTASDIAITAREIIRLRAKANELFVKETGQPIEKIEKDMHRDFWLSAEEAVEYGLVDKILASEADLP